MAQAHPQTREIQPDQWVGFLDGLSRDLRGESVSVQFVDPELGYQIEMRQIPLVGVSADLRAGGGPRIEVMVGSEGFDHTTHSVFDPKVIRVEQDEQGKPQVLEIESAGGRKTLVFLKLPV
jgi:hypothetical protein